MFYLEWLLLRGTIKNHIVVHWSGKRFFGLRRFIRYYLLPKNIWLILYFLHCVSWYVLSLSLQVSDAWSTFSIFPLAREDLVFLHSLVGVLAWFPLLGWSLRNFTVVITPIWIFIFFIIASKRRFKVEVFSIRDILDSTSHFDIL